MGAGGATVSVDGGARLGIRSVAVSIRFLVFLLVPPSQIPKRSTPIHVATIIGKRTLELEVKSSKISGQRRFKDYLVLRNKGITSITIILAV